MVSFMANSNAREKHEILVIPAILQAATIFAPLSFTNAQKQEISSFHIYNIFRNICLIIPSVITQGLKTYAFYL